MKRLVATLLFAAWLSAAQPLIRIEKPQTPPDWALAERALLRAYTDAAAEFAAKYVDDRGYFRCVERWGGNDGPDDVMETFHNWTLLHALGAPDGLLDLYRKIWEGHIRQFTAAKAPSTQAAKEGMFFKEFVTSVDWEHTGEGLAAFHFYALSSPQDSEYVRRTRRFAGLFMGEDPTAANYDKQHKIIRSLLNGSRGPILTPASVFDWGGEVVEGHPERHDRYRAAANVRGDHPLNMGACSLGFNAFALTGDKKYRDWVLEYAGAWRDRILTNGGNIPTNIGLDGKVGGEWGGKWYGGTFGWNFDPAVSGSAQLGTPAYDPEPVVWRYMGAGPFADAGEMRAFLTGLNNTPNLLPLCVRRLDGELIGIQTFMSNSPADLKIELGHIWYSPAAQGTGALKEATYLMLAHAFSLGYQRVEWKCNALNERSRRVALRMGFIFEGIQEAHVIIKNRRRDTAWFRILASEWPTLQEKHAAQER